MADKNTVYMSEKQKVKEITDKLEAGLKELFESEKYKSYLSTMSKFHNYSFNNTLLIAMQKPEATLVAGYQAWQKNFERHVNKGEKAIRILAPAPYKIKEERDKLDPVTGEMMFDENGMPQKEETEVTIPAFRAVSVFDVSQTDGKPIPELEVNELLSTVEGYEDFVQALMNISPVPIAFEDIPGDSKGYFSTAEKRIAVQENMSESQTLKTMVHVELVNICYDSNGEIHETEELTEMWAWKKPNAANKDEMYTRLQGDVTFDGVDFGYNPDKIVLHDIKMFAKPGQKLAFVGSTGAGKTTITNLINRFYDIQDGKIRYDGININHIKKDDLRRSLGIVLQDTNLFTGTIMDNIRYGRLNAADEECIAAAKLANADGFIKRLPDGYNTVLTGGGANLSQGQRQLLAIARAAVADPPVLILDEATSSIDTRTEKLVQRGMDALMTGRTSFVIAHRLSTVRNADCIMVMEQGRIIERGTHDQLMEEKGRYYQLYTGKSISA